VSRGANGTRQVIKVLPGGVNVVSFGTNRGFVQRPLRPGFVQRTVIADGRQDVYVYRIVSYRGVTYQRYVPTVFYQPQFYAWAATPWPAPVAFAWGFSAEPWFGFNSRYFTPEAAYPSASAWLTDYAIASTLSDGYAQQEAEDALPPSGIAGGTPISPAIKQEIADQVARQLAQDRANAQKTRPPGSGTEGPPPALDPSNRVFVVSMGFNVKSLGTSCVLTPGDFIRRTEDQMDANGTVGVVVVNSKPGDCPVRTATRVQLVALQDMANTFRQKVGAGEEVLAKNAGKGGVPAAPPLAPTYSRDGQDKPDDTVADTTLINQALLTANQAEVEAITAAASGG